MNRLPSRCEYANIHGADLVFMMTYSHRGLKQGTKST